MSETKELYAKFGVTVRATLETDDSEPNFPDFESAEETEDFKRHYENGDFEYVGIIVTVEYDHAEIAQNAVWGTEHGYLGHFEGKAINADAWENTPAEYGVDEATGFGTVMMGSTLNGVITEALGNAMNWAKRNGTLAMRRAIWAADAWADPNAKAHSFKRTRVGTAGYAALKFEWTLWDSGPWEDALTGLFAAAEVLAHEAGSDVPPTWDVGHGSACDGDESYPASMFSDLYADGTVTTADLITFGDVMARYLGILSKAGMIPEEYRES